MPLPGSRTWGGTWNTSWDHSWERNAGEDAEITRRGVRHANGWFAAVPIQSDVPSQFVKAGRT